MHIAILAPTHKSFIAEFLPNIVLSKLPDGYFGAPFIGTIIKELLNQNHIVTAITTSTTNDSNYTIKKYSYENFTWIVIPSRPRSISFNGNKLGYILDFYALEIKNMLQALSDSKPDFVHAHWSYEFAKTAVKSGFPYLVTVHDNAYQVLRYFKNIFRFGRLLMSEQVLRKVKFASTVSPYMRNYVNKRCKCVKIIPNPTVINLNSSQIQELIIAKIKTLHAPIIIMISNGWDARKNGKNGLMAFKELQKTFPNATLHLYGGDTAQNGLANTDATLLGMHNVFFNGPVPHKILIKAINNAHLLLHPALEESFGVVLIEAMSCGVPAIGGIKSGAVPWVIAEQQLLVDVTNVNGMVTKIVQIINNKSLYLKLADDGYQNVVNRFSSTAVVKEYINYYQQILASKL